MCMHSVKHESGTFCIAREINHHPLLASCYEGRLCQSLLGRANSVFWREGREIRAEMWVGEKRTGIHLRCSKNDSRARQQASSEGKRIWAQMSGNQPGDLMDHSQRCLLNSICRNRQTFGSLPRRDCPLRRSPLTGVVIDLLSNA